jgi:hypothetical protein
MSFTRFALGRRRWMSRLAAYAGGKKHLARDFTLRRVIAYDFGYPDDW